MKDTILFGKDFKPFPKNLYTLKLKQNAKFTTSISLEYDQQQTSTVIDLTQTITGYSTVASNTSAQAQKVNNADQLYKNLDYFDWEKIFFELYDYKQENDFHNLYIEKNTLRKIMDNKNYTVDADATIGDISTLEDICIHVLKKYVYTFYNTIRRKWCTENLEYTTLLSTDENFVDYHITVDKKEKVMTKKIMKLAACPTKLKVYEKDNPDLKSIIFDAHLFQPLITDEEDLLTIQPNGGLNKGEADLVQKLKEWIKTNKNTDPYKKCKFYLLRNSLYLIQCMELIIYQIEEDWKSYFLDVLTLF